MNYLTTHLATLRFDWAAINTALVLAMLAATTLLLYAQLRGLRVRTARGLERIFEQLDLLRLDAMERASAPSPRVARSEQRAAIATDGVATADYRAATRLAERGTSIQEISERCGLVSGEARVLLALQQARARRSVAA
ncbi:MAG: DUF2802 domain-containing protein [Steroidobacteraceae bacterium]